ncbi:WD domain, G-beta repeat-containing protein [Acanthamoeba castellanii str. Neff]|uniref:WD domain, G-beta repeat-containing protein n=1 Tax=Acanthamoeba castellanii (strain ATCC 30010 / Neff) TaxID=1257118 RepID=L8GRP5_ACACF|nr:WD domain, G-beta repeat-containing protein [Acanthamoeba castellanii str. Neff]ELR14816.1 WD domain, G-beta repeat-containing protein [Acanthamoeba castellanii str. Neff]
MSHPHLTSLVFDRTGTELLASYGGDYIYLLSLAGGTDGVTLTEGMEMEGGIRAASPTRPQRGGDEGDCGDMMNSQPTTSPPKRKRKRTRSEEAVDMDEDEDDEKRQEVNDENEEDDEMDEHSEREEDEEDEEEEEGEEEDDDISFLTDDDDDDPWALQDDADSELDEDPRIRNPDVSIEYERQWKGHLNVRTIKEVNYFGPNDQYIISGSDDGHIFMWEKQTGKLVQLLKGDAAIVNCVQGHPLGYPTLAASGLGHDIKVFMPVAKSACCLDHAERVMDKNTHTLEHGRSLTQSALTEEMMQRLIAFMREDEREDEPEAQASQNCVLS